MEKSGIYQILNTKSGKLYIGSAVYLTRRFTEHKRQLNKQIHNNKFLQAAWNKYGAAAFGFQILEYVSDIDLLIEREQFWLDKTNCFQKNIGYNLSPTAKSILGYRFSDEQKAKVSAGLKGRKKSAEHRANIWKNRKVTPEFSARMSENGEKLKGRKQSEEHRKNKALAQTGEKNHQAKLTDNQVREIKRRLQNGETGRKIATDFNVRESLVSRIKNGKRRASVQ
ncbi:MAG TPA: GIY-YIG nuclease family protein [Pyrinomonadaceae bacterium]|jgi:group I intron endonuclease